MENEVAKAVTDLTELNDLLLEVGKLNVKEMIEIIGNKNPEYLENLPSVNDSPEKSADLMLDYGIWRILWLHNNYQSIWDKVTDAYLKSATEEERPQLVKTLWTHVEMVIKG